MLGGVEVCISQRSTILVIGIISIGGERINRGGIMAKVFEDYFSELQADMVSIGLEYIENLPIRYIYIVHMKAK